MARKSKSNLPLARVARSRRSPFARVGAARRRWVGRSELVGAGIACGVTVLMGAVLAGFGAANPNGIEVVSVAPKGPLEAPVVCEPSANGPGCLLAAPLYHVKEGRYHMGENYDYGQTPCGWTDDGDGNKGLWSIPEPCVDESRWDLSWVYLDSVGLFPLD